MIAVVDTRTHKGAYVFGLVSSSINSSGLIGNHV